MDSSNNSWVDILRHLPSRGSLLPQHAPATRSRRKAPSSAPTISSEKICCATKLLLPSFAPSYQTGFVMREQAPGANLLHDSVSGASSLVSTEICFAGACFRSKLPRMYWLGYLPWRVFQEQAPSCVLVGVLTRERVSGTCFKSKLYRVYRP